MKKTALIIALSTAAPALAQVTVEYSSPALSISIPDNNTSGISSSLTVTGGGVISDINVHLEISGATARNGDYYAYLQHGTGFAVLLNRVGKTSDSALGYGDAGFNVTLDDQQTQNDGVTSKDIHNYRTITFGDETTPLGSSLTGSWAPDGRNVDPVQVLDSSARSALLGVFNGLSSDGTWTLFVADLFPTGTGKLDQWSIQVSTVPEPGEWAALSGVALLLWAWNRRWKAGRAIRS